MNIRTVRETDNEALARIIRATFEEHHAPVQGTVYSDPTTDQLYALFQADKAILWVGELDGKVVGCCGIYPTEGLPEDCVELVKFYLSPEARGQGIGKALMERSIASARQLGFHTLYLESLSAFSRAISLYEKYGFVRLKHPLGNSGHSGCNVWMLKSG